MTAVEYFSQQALQYSKRSQQGFWGWIKAKETQAVRDLLLPAKSALDLACGSGHYTNLMFDAGLEHVTCVDASRTMLCQIHQPRAIKICADIESFEQHECFDLIICAGALEFLKDPQRLIERASAWLKPSGRLVLLLPTRHFANYFYRFFHLRHGVSLKLFKKSEVLTWPNKAGLSFKSLSYPVPTSMVVLLEKS